MATRKGMAEMGRKRMVFICSPYRGHGETKEEAKKDFYKNKRLAMFAARYAVDQGYLPYAPHLYFTNFLADSDLDERERGINLGLSWLAQCDEMWVIGHEISEGMEAEIAKAREWGIRIIRYVKPRTPEDRLLDAIFFPGIRFREMD